LIEIALSSPLLARRRTFSRSNRRQVVSYRHKKRYIEGRSRVRGIESLREKITKEREREGRDYNRVEGMEGREGKDENPRLAKIPSPLTLAILVMMVRSGAEEPREEGGRRWGGG